MWSQVRHSLNLIQPESQPLLCLWLTCLNCEPRLLGVHSLVTQRHGQVFRRLRHLMLLCYLAGLSADFFLRRPLLARQTIVKCIIRVMSSCWEEFRLRLRLIIGRLWFELSSRTFSATRLERWRINMLGSIVGLVMTWSTFRHITILELLCTGLIELGL